MSQVEENSAIECTDIAINSDKNGEASASAINVSLNEKENEITSRLDRSEIKIQENEIELEDTNDSTMGQTSQLDENNIALELKSTEKETACRTERSRMTLPNSRSNDFSTTNTSKINEAEQALISKLEEEIKERTNERDKYREKLAEAERKIADLEASIYNSIDSTDKAEVFTQHAMEELKNKLDQTTMQLEDRVVVVANQEKQINALNNQVTTLKEVVAITRDLLQIRNTEVKHLQAEVDDMETRISEERERHNTMMTKMDAAVRLNADLKKEYETQLNLFRDLRVKYEEKVTLLSEEKRALEANQSVGN